MKPPIFRKFDSGKLEISKYALSRMLIFIQDALHKQEAGGVLLGRYIRESLDIVIDEVTVPMIGDRRRKFSFFRSRRSHQKVLDKVWQETGGTSVYLGEWHTHPESYPVPSRTDLKDWKRKLREDVFDGDALYFIILGIKSLRIWEGRKSSLSCELIGELCYLGERNVKDKYSS